MTHDNRRSLGLVAKAIAATAVAAALSAMTHAAHAQDSAAQPDPVLKAADANEQGDGTMSAAARRARDVGALPFSDADLALKAAANAAAAARSGAASAVTPAQFSAAGGGTGLGPNAPTIVGGINVAGFGGGTSVTNVSPPDTNGAIGPSSYIQIVNEVVGVYNRTTGALVTSASLDTLANASSSVSSFDPQMIWDGQTNRFYYAMDSIFSSTDNRISYGFSTTSNPGNFTTDWCHYTMSYGSLFPDYPKLGDSKFFAIFGFNGFTSSFVGSGISAVSKPPAGTACPAVTTFHTGTKLNLKDPSGAQLFTPIPANQVDTSGAGWAVLRNGGLPSTNIWFLRITRNSALNPVFSAAKSAAVASYTVPPAADQPTVTQTLDTLDARLTQAVQAIDPVNGKFAFWTQHTITNGSAAEVRWYEVDPAPAVPVVLQSGDISGGSIHLFNAAISPDRRVKTGSPSAFGGSFVIEYSVSSKASSIPARIVAGSSVLHGALSFLNVINGVGPYIDFTCGAGQTCRWGDYSGASPDPLPTLATSGVVWGANQFSGVVSPPPGASNWRTQIFQVAP